MTFPRRGPISRPARAPERVSGPASPCSSCGSLEWYVTRDRITRCTVCHPPILRTPAVHYGLLRARASR
jgi:hypothetical protein